MQGQKANHNGYEIEYNVRYQKYYWKVWQRYRHEENQITFSPCLSKSFPDKLPADNR